MNRQTFLLGLLFTLSSVLLLFIAVSKGKEQSQNSESVESVHVGTFKHTEITKTESISALTPNSTNMSSSSSKISPALLLELQSSPTTNIIVTMKADTSGVLDQLNQREFATREERLNTVSSTLKNHAEQEQKEVLAYLQSTGLAVESMWISNQVVVKGASLGVVQCLAARADVKEVKEDAKIMLDDPVE